MERYSQVIFQSGRRIAYKHAAEMEAWAKTNAPWQDRTGAARAGLKATVEENGPTAEIILAHGVDYGVWLELAHGGRYAIIAPAIDTFAPRVWRDIQNMMNLKLIAK